MAVLVTGGAGYIGSHTVALLSQQQRDVVVLDSLELGTKSRIGTVPFFQGNISDERLIEKICKKHNITEVIHFAAYKAVGESMEQPLRYYSNNVGGTIDLVRALLANGVERMVFSSSAAVYGNPDLVPVTEDSPLLPESVYAETKAVMERFLASCDEIGMRSVSLRYFNAAGASSDSSIGEDWSMSQNLVPLVMKAILGFSGPLNVFGNDYPTPDGTCIRDYIHVSDLSKSHIAALKAVERQELHEVYNVGSGIGYSVHEVIDQIEKTIGRSTHSTVVGRRAGDTPKLIAGIEKIQRDLGWKPERSLKEMIDSAWQAWNAK